MNPDAPPMVSFRQVHKSFDGKTPAARALTLDVAPGELLAVAAGSVADMGEGALPATESEVIFQGDHIRRRLEVRLPGAPAAIAWQPHYGRTLRPEPAG
jgi:hypothetical protein